MKAYSPEPMVGDVWEDCDKRMNGRRCKVISIDDGKATMQHVCGFPTTKVSVRRMYPHSTGWRLVERATNIKDASLTVAGSVAGSAAGTSNPVT